MNFFVLAFVLFMAYWWGNQGFFSAVLHTAAVIIAGSLAFATWELWTYGVFMKIKTHFRHQSIIIIVFNSPIAWCNLGKHLPTWAICYVTNMMSMWNWSFPNLSNEYIYMFWFLPKSFFNNWRWQILFGIVGFGDLWCSLIVSAN